MTRFISRLLFFWVVISSLSINAECKNRALLIGIGDYPSDSGWRKLSSENDVELLGKLLKDDFEVVRLLNSSASHDGIIKALVRLENSVQKGDTIFVLLSGHGQLMEPVADAKELDEAFIPYDAPKAYSNKYKGNRHLRDKELSKHVDLLRTKAGPKGLIVIAVDACHSGGMERDVVDKPYVIRGTSDIFGPSDEEKKYELLSYNLRNNGIDKIQDERGQSRVIYFEACKSYQSNCEIIIGGTNYGRLSYAIYNNLSRGLSFGKSKSFFEGIESFYLANKKGYPVQKPLMVDSL